jgi:hypothetical protein
MRNDGVGNASHTTLASASIRLSARAGHRSRRDTDRAAATVPTIRVLPRLFMRIERPGAGASTGSCRRHTDRVSRTTTPEIMSPRHSAGSFRLLTVRPWPRGVFEKLETYPQRDIVRRDSTRNSLAVGVNSLGCLLTGFLLHAQFAGTRVVQRAEWTLEPRCILSARRVSRSDRNACVVCQRANHRGISNHLASEDQRSNRRGKHNPVPRRGLRSARDVPECEAASYPSYG